MKVFDKFEIGDIVVSLTRVPGARSVGELIKIKENSRETMLEYKDTKSSTKDDEFRAATPNEQYHYSLGRRNISDIKEPTYEIY